MGRKRVNNPVPKVHEDLQGFNLELNEFGQITWKEKIDDLNKFLNKTVPDKKLIHRLDKNLQEGIFTKEDLGVNVKLDPEDVTEFKIESEDEKDLSFDDLMGTGFDSEGLPKKSKKKTKPSQD